MSASKNPLASSLLPWWVLWFAFAQSPLILFYLFGRGDGMDVGQIAYTTLIPALVALFIRFVLLPRFTTKARAFPFFLIGLAAAEGAAILAIIMASPARTALFALSYGLLLLYIPLFASRYDSKVPAKPFQSTPDS